MAFTKIVGAGIHTLSNVHTHNVNSSGIITATSFVGPFNGSDGDFSGNVTIDGNLIVNGFPYTTSNNDDWKTQYVGPIMMTDVDVDGNAKTIAFHSWNNSTYGEFFATTDNSSWTATGYDTAGRIIGQIQLLAGA